jgi:hypothetical protein
MYKTIVAFLLISLASGCSTYSGTQSTAEMEFCWERGMNFQWIEESTRRPIVQPYGFPK